MALADDFARLNRVRWWFFGLLAASYMLGSFYRVAPSVIADQLMASFNTSGAALGSLVAMYFYTYTAMQMPAGVLADTLGPRISAGGGVAVVGIGALLFGLAPVFVVAGAGRLLIGLGACTIFLGIMKMNSTWFAPRHYGALSGLTVFLGNLGSYLSTEPLAALLTRYSWRDVFLVTGLVTLVLAALIVTFVRNRPEEAGLTPVAASSEDQGRRWLRDLIEVFKSRQAWAVFWVCFGTGGPFFAFAGLWGVPFLQDVFGLGRTQAALYTSLSLGALALLALVMGWVSDRAGRRKPFLLGSALIMCLVWLSMLELPWGPGASAWLLFAGLGASGSVAAASYATVKESLPPAVAGTSVALANTGLFLGVAVAQPVFGWLLDLGWQGSASNGVRHYSLTDYQHGLWFCLSLTVMSLIAASFVRETYGRDILSSNRSN